MAQAGGWRETLHKRIAQAIKDAREARGMSAQELADATGQWGHPISRSQIANYESGRKLGLDVSELLALAATLEIPLALLLFPDYPNGKAELLPGLYADGRDSVRWLSGASSLPLEAAGDTARTRRSNPGVELVSAVEALAHTDQELLSLRMMAQAMNAPREAVDSVMRLIRDREEKLAALTKRIQEKNVELWGFERGSDG
jgi:transcriptional regulator with XRE-family HTH domain